MMREQPGRSKEVARLEGYLERDPDNWTLRADLFDAALAAGERGVALRQLEAAKRERPDDPGWKHRHAVLLLAEHAYQEAEGVLTELLRQGHDVPAIRHNLGFACFGQGRWADARDAVSPLLDATGDGVAEVALVLWLRCLHRLDQLPEGLGRFREICAQRPVTAEAWGVASLMAIDEGLMEEAKAWSDMALDARPDQMEALAARASLLLGDLDARGAEQWFAAALKQNATDGRSWSGIAFARMLVGDLPAAGAAFEKAVATMPDHVGTWIGWGWCQVLGKNPLAARRTFEQALQIDRNVAEAHGGLAVALARLGDTGAARTEIDVALRLDRMNLSARYAEAVLNGEAENPAAFERMARRLLAKHPAGGRAKPGRTMEDVVFGERPDRQGE